MTTRSRDWLLVAFLSDELRDAYAFYQGILYAIETRGEAELKSVLYPTKNDAQYCSLPKAMKKARRTHYP